jgi:hypothetical protein
MQMDRRPRLAAFPRLGLANLPTPLGPMKHHRRADKRTERLSLQMLKQTAGGIEENAMPEAQSDIDYTVDIGRHETTFRANTAKGEEFLGGVELTMSNEEAHKFMQDARAAGLTVKSFF